MRRVRAQAAAATCERDLAAFLNIPHEFDATDTALDNRPSPTVMKRSGSTRVARKIGSYDDDDSADSANNSQSEVQKPTG